MSSASPTSSVALPPPVEQLLTDLVSAAQTCFRDDLRSVILFGSGAEGRLRQTSDLNLMFVLGRFDKERVDAFREPLRVACIAGHAAPMFVLETELPAAANAFAVKFDDIGRRRRILFGADVIAGLTASRAAKKSRLEQILLNLTLRLRQQYAATSLREEHLATVIAETAGPLRSAAATLLELEGRDVASPKEALELVAAALGDSHDPHIFGFISQARESGSLPPGIAGPLVLQLAAMAEAMRLRTEKVDEQGGNP